MLAPHHHFVDVRTGKIHDVAWDALQVKGVDSLDGLDVTEHQVVLRGVRKEQKRR
jgi:Fe2+ or Zn2+ uptake regulation protein